MARTVKTSEKLKARLIALGYPVSSVERCYPGYWQRSRGAFAWFALLKYPGGGVGDIGSNETMRACLAMPDTELKAEVGFRWGE